MTREEYLRYGLEIGHLKFSEYLELTKPLKLPEGPDEAADEYVQTLADRADEDLRIDTTLETAFRAGAKWQKAKMMEKAVEATVVAGKEGNKWAVTYIGDYESMLKICKAGDEVRLIVLPKE